MKNRFFQQLLLVFFILLRLSAVGQNSATTGVRDGFRDAQLGAKLRTFNGMSLTSESEGQQYYERASDKLSMGKGTLKSIVYCFEKGMLVDIHLKATAGANGKAILAEITAVYGAPSKQATIMGAPVNYWRTPTMLLTFVEGPQIRVSYALFSSLKQGS